MTIQKQIDIAMMHYRAGNKASAILILESMIRSAMSNKQIRLAKNALNQVYNNQ